MENEVRFLQEALDDVEEIILYLEQHNVEAAIRMQDEIIKKANDLSSFPKLGRLVPEKKMSAAGYRMLPVKPYIMFYRVIERNIFIYRVLHGASNYPMLYEKMTQVNGDIEE